jgi:GxxExxY protein
MGIGNAYTVRDLFLIFLSSIFLSEKETHVPIEIKADIRRPSPDEFKGLAYDVMACIFKVHNEIGRFCDEKIYERLVAKRFGNIETEVPVVASFDTFSKTYFLDMLIQGCTIFELKAVECFSPEHRGQLLNYLLLTDIPRGKLVNVRPEIVQHEFVNTTLRPQDRKRFVVDDAEFCPLNGTDARWRDFLLGAIHDWGTGLDLHLYESAISHVFGGDDAVLRNIEIIADDVKIGEQTVRLTSSCAIFKVTAIHESEQRYEQHARRFLNHTRLPAIHWVNVNRETVRLKTLLRQEN